MLGKPIPLGGHPQQRFALMLIVRLVGMTTTFLRAFSVMIRCRHELRRYADNFNVAAFRALEGIEVAAIVLRFDPK